MPARKTLIGLKPGPLRHRRRRRTPANAPSIASLAAGLEVNVGYGLRKLRSERKLSICALAEKSGLAVNTLSLIEIWCFAHQIYTTVQPSATLHWMDQRE